MHRNWLVMKLCIHCYNSVFTAATCGAEVLRSRNIGGENMVLSNTNKRAETEMVLSVSVGKLLERTVGLPIPGKSSSMNELTAANEGLPKRVMFHATVARANIR